MSRTDLDPEACYRAVQSRDRRFDGTFWTAVRTTGIYCRPSCPARTPAPENVTFHPSAASAQGAGYRACKRCLPDAAPGSPHWDVRADLAGRAMRLISDGVVDRDGVEGLALRLGYSSRQLNRLLTDELGAGPLALARARRAQTARVLIESSHLSFGDIAFAAGFASVRQFNETVREIYAASPTELRGARGAARARPGSLTVRLAVRTPFAGAALLDFLSVRTIPGVEAVTDSTYARTLELPRSWGTLQMNLHDLPGPGTAFVEATFRLQDLRDLTAAVERARRLIDADCDPVAVDLALGADPMLAPLVQRRPGLRVPGHVDGHEIAVRAVLGQQVSVAAARTHASRLVEAHGRRIETGIADLDRLFPDAAHVAQLDPEEFAIPRSRGRALVALSSAIADGTVDLSRGVDRDDVRAAMTAVHGIGPWTADYIALRALAHPDVFLPTDTGVTTSLRTWGVDVKAASGVADAWRPWRSYALIHLWQALADRHAATKGIQ